MEISSVVAIVSSIVGSFGGIEFIRWLGSRKKNEVDWLEERLAQRDKKIDSLYLDLRKSESEKLDWIHKYHELELIYKEAEWNRCNVANCDRRIPPRTTISETIKNNDK